MEIALAYVKSETQVLYHHFGESSNPSAERAQCFDLDQLADKNLNGVFLPKEFLSSELLLERLEKTASHAPIKTIERETLSSEDFDRLPAETAKKLTKSTYNTWVLQNNLSLMENIFPISQHLKSLWPNDRTTFFEELWHLLKLNLGATNLKIAYNHLRKAEKENEKNQLIRVVVEGVNKPNPTENKELGEALFKHYENQFGSNFELESFDEATSQITILASINASPVIIMAEVFEFGKLQHALLKGLFDGVQLEL